MERLQIQKEAEEFVDELVSIKGHEFLQKERELILKAYVVASKAHEGMVRFSGEPFINHPKEVARILASLGMDAVTITAGLLHDVVEDSDGKVTLDDIVKIFGREIARIVDGVTKVSSINPPVGMNDVKRKIETIQKMFLAMAEDMRVIFVKLADRLHNMRTIQYVKDEGKRRYKALETLEIYAPIAHKLGIHSIKSELEDLAFKVLYPEEYYMLKRLVAEKKKEREARTREYMDILKAALEEHGIEAKVEGRYKHYYSIWRKMKERGKKFEEIYDLIAIRAIVEDVPTCYSVLGIVHSIWPPLPGRIKDYIAAPKSNGYKSLHTTVITQYGEPLEIQIRDERMHVEAEYGLIAHWIYKEKPDLKSAQEWFERLLEWRKEISQGIVGIDDIKKELQMDEVFVFTPKGEIKHLPKGATPIDFAYAIHTEIGHHFAGAKVNGKMVPIDYQLQNGDVVEIIVNRNSPGPSLDWLKYAKSPRTKAKIRRFFKEKFGGELVERGKDILRKISKKLGKSLEEIMDIDGLKKMREGLSEREFFMKIGEGTITFQDLLEAITGEEKTQIKKKRRKKVSTNSSPVVVGNLKNIEVHIAKCCNPIMGDPIVGVVSRRGITIHRMDCKNLKGIDEDRIFDARWVTDAVGSFDAFLRIVVVRKSDIGNLINYIGDHGVDFVSAKILTPNREPAVVKVHVKVRDTEELSILINNLKNHKCVMSVERVVG